MTILLLKMMILVLTLEPDAAAVGILAHEHMHRTGLTCRRIYMYLPITTSG